MDKTITYQRKEAKRKRKKCQEINRYYGYGRACNKKSSRIYSQGIICIILVYNNNNGSK
jgi:hypothetical protein